MENASKALIIAGAILISILIIGLGVYFYNMAASAGKRANLDSQAADAHNGQFTSYFGNSQSATDVKNLMQTVRSNNITSQTNGETAKIYIIYNTKVTEPYEVSADVKSGSTYKINVPNDTSTDEDSNDTNSIKKPTKSTDPAFYSNGYIRIIEVTRVDKTTK